MIFLKNVSLQFDQKVILNNVDFKVNQGDRVAIIGESGCGKSTLLKLILGFLQPNNGDVLYNGVSISSMTTSELRSMRMKVGMLFQSAALFDSMTVGENVAFSWCENQGEDYDKVSDKVNEVLEMVDMAGYADDMPASLSGGQRKRIGLARTIAMSPDVILYDEPTTGLDPILSTSIENLIVKLSKEFGITTIMVSHQKSTILRTVDTIYMMNDANLIYAGTPLTIEKSDNELVRNFMSGGL